MFHESLHGYAKGSLWTDSWLGGKSFVLFYPTAASEVLLVCSDTAAVEWPYLFGSFTMANVLRARELKRLF